MTSLVNPGKKSMSKNNDQKKIFAGLDSDLRNRLKVYPIETVRFELTKHYKEEPDLSRNSFHLSDESIIQKNLNEVARLGLEQLLKKMLWPASNPAANALCSTSKLSGKSQNSLSIPNKKSDNAQNIPSKSTNPSSDSTSSDEGYSSDTSDNLNSEDPDSKNYDQSKKQGPQIMERNSAQKKKKFVLKPLDNDVAILKIASKPAATFLESFVSARHLLKDHSLSKLIEELRSSPNKLRIHFIIVTGLTSPNFIESKCSQLLRYMSYFERNKISKSGVRYVYILTADSGSKLFQNFENLTTKIEDIQKSFKNPGLSNQERKSLESQAVSLKLVDKYFKTLKADLLLIDPKKIVKSQNLEQDHKSPSLRREDQSGIQKMFAEAQKDFEDMFLSFQASMQGKKKQKKVKP